MLPTPTEEETCLGNEFDAQEAAREKRYFPSNSKVYHFHPIAFVEQMMLINEGYKDVSLADKITFYGYHNSDSKGCFRRCTDMVGSVGYKPVAVTDNSVIQMTKYKSTKVSHPIKSIPFIKYFLKK